MLTSMHRAAYREASKALETKLSGRVPAQLEHAYARVPVRQSVHPVARIRQSQSGWLNSKRHFSSVVRYFTSQSVGVKRSGPALRPTSNSIVWNAVRHSSGRAPFASTLRPNLTGGTLGRTAGGYSMGGGRIGAQRYFSHGPASQAQVVQNVSQAVRAFLVGGQKAQFNGTNPVTGNKKYKAVTKLQHETGQKIKSFHISSPGSKIRFNLNPTVTALTSLRNVPGYQSEEEEQHLNTDGLLDILSTDFSRQLQELCVVLADLKRLAVLGDLPITYQGSALCIHFPGCDADTVDRLCRELGIQRGLVVQDEEFDAFAGTEMALLFPFAPSETNSESGEAFFDIPAKKQAEKIQWQHMLTPSDRSSAHSTTSDPGFEEEFVADNPWATTVSDEQMSNISEEDYGSSHSPYEYQGFEGIYRFIEQCDDARRH